MASALISMARKRGCGIGGEIRIARTAGEHHDAALLQVPYGAASDERLGHLVHLDGAHHAGEDVLLFQSVLQGQGIDDRGEHAHVVGGYAVHLLGLLGNATKEVAAANHDGDFNA